MKKFRSVQLLRQPGCYQATPRVVCYLATPRVGYYQATPRVIIKLTRIPTSAWAAPLIMLETKHLWPGASRSVNRFFSVSKKARPVSTVLPLSRSSSLVSRAHDKYLEREDGLVSVFGYMTFLKSYKWSNENVWMIGSLPGFSVHLLCFSLKLFQGSFVHLSHKMQELSTDRTLASVHVTDENDVHVVLANSAHFLYLHHCKGLHLQLYIQH